MKFTYQAYRCLLDPLRENGYAFRNYHKQSNAAHCGIFRYGMDSSLVQVVRLAELEATESISSTWFFQYGSRGS